jgi:hypothetical protein
MSPTDSFENETRLRALLREWRVIASLPPRFQEHVWRRIEQADAPSESSPWAVFLHWLVRATARPVPAMAYVTALLMVGLSIGYWHAHQARTQWDRNLAQRYVQAVDPYQASARN